jgi:hypothetical protein
MQPAITTIAAIPATTASGRARIVRMLEFVTCPAEMITNANAGPRILGRI